MFILGLLLGPALGLLAADFLARPGMDRRVASGLVLAAALVVLLIPVIALELRTGLIAGFLLGTLLYVTPKDFATAE